MRRKSAYMWTLFRGYPHIWVWLLGLEIFRPKSPPKNAAEKSFQNKRRIFQNKRRKNVDFQNKRRKHIMQNKN